MEGANLSRWGWIAKTLDWFDERLDLRARQELMGHKVVPLHSGTTWYYFGGITSSFC
jgi:hypothetical protein